LPRLLYLIVERSETVSVLIVIYRHYHNIVELNVVKIVDCRVFTINRAHHGFNRRIIEKSSGQFLTTLVVDPISSPANGQFFITTR
jgi:hypothetical protein